MAKKKRQLRILLILLAVAVALLTATMLWSRYRTAQETAEQEASVIHVDLVEKPTALRYCNGTDTLSFEKKGDSWSSTDQPDFPLDSDTIESLVETLTSLTAEREVDIVDDLDAYGLKSPKQWVEVTDQEGNCAVLYLGKASGENYFAQKKDGNKIYTVSADLKEELDENLYDRASLAKLPTLSSSNLNQVTLTGKPISRLEIKAEAVESEDDSTTADGSGSVTEDGSSSTEDQEPAMEYHWYLTGEVDVTEEAYLSQLRSELTSLSFDSLAAFQPKALKEYGLDDPIATVNMTYQEDGRKKTVTLELGKTTTEDGTEYRYAILDGNQEEVYRIASSKVEQILAGAQKGYAQASADYTEAQRETAS